MTDSALNAAQQAPSRNAASNDRERVLAMLRNPSDELRTSLAKTCANLGGPMPDRLVRSALFTIADAIEQAWPIDLPSEDKPMPNDRGWPATPLWPDPDEF